MVRGQTCGQYSNSLPIATGLRAQQAVAQRPSFCELLSHYMEKSRSEDGAAGVGYAWRVSLQVKRMVFMSPKLLA